MLDYTAKLINIIYLIDIYQFNTHYLSIMQVVNSTKFVNKITEAFCSLLTKSNLTLYFMKIAIKLIMIFSVAGFVLASCEGPQGTPGKDANSSCLKCHNTAKTEAIEEAFDASAHFEGNPRTGKYCARCHSNEGFKEVTRKPWATGALISATNDIPNGTRMDCETCHQHSSFEFADDTITQVLRTTAPVSLAYDNYSKTTDFGEINNLCSSCHQIRGARYVAYSDATPPTGGPVTNKAFSELPYFPFDNTKEATTVKYTVGTSFSVHDGNQSNLFAGINGYEYAGKTYTRTWKHSDNSCTDCHMNEYDPATETGGHTFKVNTAKCTECHNGSDKITPVQSLIDAKRIELAEILVTRKVFKKTTGSSGVSYSAVPSHDFYGTLFPGVSSATKYATALPATNTVSASTGLVVYGNTVTWATDADFALRIGREWKYGELGAAYNYGYINSELSKGVHNPTYALQLLQNSIDWLNAN
jgi:hypothetical protein